MWKKPQAGRDLLPPCMLRRNPRNGLFVGNNPTSLWDSLGLDVDINLFKPGASLHRTANQIPANSNAILIAGHGSPFGTHLSPSLLAKK